MIVFDRLELRNFVVFEDIGLDFSSDPERPLTVVRGENETGKTTLMRGLQWVLFGDSAFPKLEFGHPFRPLWAEKQEGNIETEGVLYLKAFDPENKTPGTWKVIRSAKSEYSEENERYTTSDQDLKVFHEMRGEWKILPTHNFEVLVRRFFPVETRGFYFVDEDEANEFVGGKESQYSAETMRTSITRSLHHLLGLHTLLETTDRLNQVAKDLGKQASNASGSGDVDELQAELDCWNGKKEASLELLKQFSKDVDTAQSKIVEYDNLLMGLGEQEEELSGLREEAEEKKGEYDTALNAQARLDAILGQSFNTENFFAGLMKPLLAATVEELEPMRAEGVLPPHEVSLLPKLLEEGLCVCSTDFAQEPAKREVVENRLAISKEFAKSRDFLHSVLVSAERQYGLTAVSWSQMVEGSLSDAQSGQSEVNETFDAWQAAKEAYEECAANSDNQSIAQNIQQRKSWDEARQRSEEKRVTAETAVAEADSGVRSCNEKLRLLQEGDERARPYRQQEAAALRLAELMTLASDTIEKEQIPEVSLLLNDIFRGAIGATDDSQFSEVGIEPFHKQSGTQYGLYSKDAHGDPKDLGIANGASRRALGVAFVLALTEATQSAVPFVADSLLHALSGKVKFNLVNSLVDGSTIDQPILFCTRDDVLAESVADLVKAQAGKSYTLTSQANVGSNAVRYADSITRNKRCAVVCECSISEFCQVCEEKDDKDEGRLTERIG